MPKVRKIEENSRSAAKNALHGAASLHGRDLSDAIQSAVGHLPDVTAKSHMGHISFLVRGKVFAFTRRNGVALKLPRERAESLVGNGKAVFLTMGKRTMKEWVVLPHAAMAGQRNGRELLVEARNFAASPPQKASPDRRLQ